jgi:hypothetical protein
MNSNFGVEVQTLNMNMFLAFIIFSETKEELILRDRGNNGLPTHGSVLASPRQVYAVTSAFSRFRIAG